MVVSTRCLINIYSWHLTVCVICQTAWLVTTRHTLLTCCHCANTDYQWLDPDAEKGHWRFSVVPQDLGGILWQLLTYRGSVTGNDSYWLARDKVTLTAEVICWFCMPLLENMWKMTAAFWQLSFCSVTNHLNSIVIPPCGAGAPSFPPCPFTFSSFPLFTFPFLSLALLVFGGTLSLTQSISRSFCSYLFMTQTRYVLLCS